ncbi:single-stranded DNA-binding protein [Saccharothrix xinjiangensis]|uniref:Single-stranded DNA-binding protein n=1 Tax=Saccharothrix xinjiangensis TaxID=204798 RepID=A0ABV9XXB4_9PSEU
MAYNETRVTVCGNVASKITRHEVGTGFSRVNFRLFTTERRWDQDQRGWVDGNRMFLSVNCWRSLADNAYASLNRGDPVVVTGRVSIKELRDEGQVRQLVEIEATAIGPNLALCTASPVRSRATPHEALVDVPGGAPAARPAPAGAPLATASPPLVEALPPPATAPPPPATASPPLTTVEALPVMTGAPPTTPPLTGPVAPAPAPAPAPVPASALPPAPGPADPAPASTAPPPTGRKRPASARTGPKRTPPTPEPASSPAGAVPPPAATPPAPDLPTPVPPPPDLTAPEVVAPRREGESALVRPGEAGRPEEVAEVLF